jgi:hypothetical protein
MKLNHVRYSANLKLFLGILLAACFVATAAHADSLFTGTFELKNEVHWGKAVLGPGVYSLTLDRFPRTIPIIIVRDAHTGKTVARLLSRLGDKTDNGDSKLLVTIRGKQRAVSSVQLAGFGEVFQMEHPFAESGGAAEEARNAGAISVEVAKK